MKVRRTVVIGGVLLIMVAMCSVAFAGQESLESLWEFLNAEDQSIIWSKGGVDGHVWRQMPELQRYGYVAGYLMGFGDGFVQAWVIIKDTNIYPYESRPYLSYKEIQEALDDLYSDYANRSINMSLLLHIIIGRSQGYLSDTEVEEGLQKFRRLMRETSNDSGGR